MLLSELLKKYLHLHSESCHALSPILPAPCAECAERNPTEDRAPEVLILSIHIYPGKGRLEGMGMDKIFLSMSWQRESLFKGSHG